MSISLVESYNAHYSYSSCSTDSAVFEQEDSPTHSHSHCLSPPAPVLTPTPSTTALSTQEGAGEAVDAYMRAAKSGRVAYAVGDVKFAAEEFDRALAIELEAETECLFDTTVGVVSGLVRKEVEVRLSAASGSGGSSSSAGSGYARILKILRARYKETEKKCKSKPGEAKWYLRMGAALVCVNQWEGAKAVYRRGLEVCKDTKALAVALQRLNEMDEELSYSPFPAASPPPPSPNRHHNHHNNHRETLRGGRPAEMVAAASRSRYAVRALSVTATTAAATGSSEMDISRACTTAQQLLLSTNGSFSAPSTLLTESKRKRFSLKSLKLRAGSMMSLRARSQTVANLNVSASASEVGLAGPEQPAAPPVDPFEPSHVSVVSSIDFTPSVIVLLRRLSVINPDTVKKRLSNCGAQGRARFASAPPIAPLIIDSDDSELDD